MPKPPTQWLQFVITSNHQQTKCQVKLTGAATKRKKATLSVASLTHRYVIKPVGEFSAKRCHSLPVPWPLTLENCHSSGQWNWLRTKFGETMSSEHCSQEEGRKEGDLLNMSLADSRPVSNELIFRQKHQFNEAKSLQTWLTAVRSALRSYCEQILSCARSVQTASLWCLRHACTQTQCNQALSWIYTTIQFD